MNKYQIIWENDGYSFEKDKDGKIRNFDTIGQALKFATEAGYSANFKIIYTIQYDLLYIKEKKDK